MNQTQKIKSPVHDRKPQVYRIALAQLGVTLILSLALLLWMGKQVGLSALMGGFVCVISNAVFMWRFFKVPVSGSPQALLKSAYWGELSKIAVTATLFVLLLTLFDEANFLAMFGTFFFVQSVHWLAPLILDV